MAKDTNGNGQLCKKIKVALASLLVGSLMLYVSVVGSNKAFAGDRIKESIVSAAGLCSIHEFITDDKVFYYEFCDSADKSTITFTYLVKTGEGSFLKPLVEGENYVRAVNDKNGPHLEIHISASALRVACTIGVAVATAMAGAGGAISTLVSWGVSAPVAAGIAAGVGVALGEACSLVTDGIWINAYPSGHIECGWLK